MNDDVNHPKHYTQGSIECIDAIAACMTNEEFAAYCQGNVLKYLWRYRSKGGLVDLEKAQWYLDKLIQIAASKASSEKFLEVEETKAPINFSEQFQLSTNEVPPIKTDSRQVLEVKRGQRWVGQDGLIWLITGYTKDKRYPVIGVNNIKGVRWLRLEWLHPDFIV
jgi:hypothetical protein